MGSSSVVAACRILVGGLLPILLMAATGGCGGRTPTQPPPPDGPFTSCPAAVEVESLDGSPSSVTYTPPAGSGGAPPLTAACTPQSGSTLPVGVHTITCTVTDALGRAASCTFSATVKVPRLTHTKFIAFGDSITLGVKSDPVPTFRVAALPDAYTFPLQGLLRQRYGAQAPVVYNEGWGGEKVDGGPTGAPSGLVRLPRVLDSYRDAEVLLLMEGTNDLLDREAGMARAIPGLRTMITRARGRQLQVFLATIPPQRPNGRRQRQVVAGLIPGFNDQIRALAASEGVPLVDVYDALKDRLNLIGIDDLHPTPEGHTVIAQTFFDAIRKQLEARTPAQ